MKTSIGFMLFFMRGILVLVLLSFLPPCFGAMPVITSVSSTLGIERRPFTYQIEASGSPTSYAANGLPPGLSINRSTGLISGTVSVGGVFDVQIAAINADGTGTASLALTIGTVGTFVSVGEPLHLAFDGAGDLTVSCKPRNHSLVKVSPDGTKRFFAFHSGPWSGVVYDPAGNLYATVCYYEYSARPDFQLDIKTFTPEGVLGLATALRAPSPDMYKTGLAIDRTGNIYLPLDWLDAILKVGGSWVPHHPVIHKPKVVAVDSNGNLFVANAAGEIIKITSNGAAVTFASGFLEPQGLAFDSAGTLYVASADSIHTVAPTGVVSPFWTGSPAIGPVGMAFDRTGALYIADRYAGRVMRIGAPPATPPAITGDAVARAAKDHPFSFQIEASGSPASFNAIGLPPGLSVDTTTGRIDGVPTQSGTFKATITATNSAGTGNSTLTLSVGAFSAFTLDPLAYNSTEMVFDSAGNLFAINGNRDIIKITPAGQASIYASGLNNALALAIDSGGNLHVSNANGDILKITSAPFATRAFATGFHDPRALAFDGEDNLYVTQSGHGERIRKITPGAVVSTFVDVLPLANCTYDLPLSGLAFDSEGFLYAASQNQGQGSIIKIAPDATWAIFAAAYNPGTLAFDSDGGLYVPSLSHSNFSENPPLTISRISTNGALSSFIDTPWSRPPPYSILAAVAVDPADDLYLGTNNGIYRVTFPPAITSRTWLRGTYGEAFHHTITATHSPTRFTASGLPLGLVVNSTSGEITGHPRRTGLFDVDLGATNATGTGRARLHLQIAKAKASIELGNLTQSFDGWPKRVSVKTTPPRLKVWVTYDDSFTPPSAPGTYAVRAVILDPNYFGEARDTLRIVKRLPPVGPKIKRGK